MNLRNVASFYVNFEDIRTNPGLIVEVFKALNLLVIRTEDDLMSDRIKYTAISDQFPSVPEGYCVPEVFLTVTQDENLKVTSVEVKSPRTPAPSFVEVLGMMIETKKSNQ